MPSLLLIDYLERSQGRYRLIQHRPVVTAAATAALLGIAPRQFGKVVMLRVAGELMLMVIPAHYRVRPDRLGALLGAAVALAQPGHFLRRFPRCEAGAMPPFGHLFGLRALASALPVDGELFFKAGSHSETVAMAAAEFRRLAHVEELAGCAGAAARPATPARLPRFLEHATTMPVVAGGRASLLRPRRARGNGATRRAGALLLPGLEPAPLRLDGSWDAG